MSSTLAPKRRREEQADLRPTKRSRIVQDLALFSPQLIHHPQPLSASQANLRKVAEWRNRCEFEAEPSAVEVDRNQHLQRPNSAPPLFMASFSTSFSQDLGSQSSINYPPPSSATSQTQRSNSRPKEKPPTVRRRLKHNEIHLVSSREERPQHVSEIIQAMTQDRDSPPPVFDWDQIESMELEFVPEERVLACMGFKQDILPETTPTSRDKVVRIEKGVFSGAILPRLDPQVAPIKKPVPDLTWGLSSNFLPKTLEETFGEVPYRTSSSGPMLPFLTYEAKAENGILFEATNQCLGNAACCLNICEMFNAKLREWDAAVHLETTCFAIASNATEARLFVCWREKRGSQYKVQRVKTFTIQDSEHLLELRKYTRNIIDHAVKSRYTLLSDNADTLENLAIASSATRKRRADA